MIIPDKEVPIQFSGRNIAYYKKLGLYTKARDVVYIKSELVMPTSGSKIWVQCDYCGKEFLKRAVDYYDKIESVGAKCACEECYGKKSQESIIAKYGTHFLNIDAFQEKRRNTCLERYGTDFVTQSEEVKEKIKETMMQNYGVDNYTKTDEYKQKSKTTSLQKYGVEHHTQTNAFKEKQIKYNQEKYGVDWYFSSDEFKGKTIATCLEKYGQENHYTEESKLKRKETCLKKYGFDSYSKTEEAKLKARDNLMKQGCLQSSYGQEHICKLVNGTLNHPFHGFFLDILYEDWLDIEYNGGGHNLSVKLAQVTEEEFAVKEKRRSAAILNKGLKQLIIECKNDKLPDDDKLKEVIFNSIEKLRNSENKKITIDLTQLH